MIKINNICKNYGQRVLFDKVSLSINAGEKIGLIGPNGSGKTTLFSMILGKTPLSSGSIDIRKGVRIGYLAQEASFESGCSVLEEITRGDPLMVELTREKDRLEAQNQTTTHRYGEILHQLQVLGFFELEHIGKKVLSGLGFKEDEFLRPITNLSGGWKMRVLLAKLLVCSYDLLLLDEPTNYLDLNAALWFKDYLSRYRGTYVLISHDRDFLDEVTNYTLVLEAGAIKKIRGNFEHYVEIREQQRLHLLKKFNEQEKKRKQLQEFIQRFHAQPNKAAQVRAKRRMLERMPQIDVPADLRASIRTFSFPPTQDSGYTVMNLENITKAYDKIRVYEDFNFEVIKGEKAVLVGENGAGKSTLLKILAGAIDIDKGKRIVGYNTTIGYFSQTRTDVLSPGNTVLDEAFSAAPQDMAAETVRTILGLFLFSGDDVDKKVSVLSGGEKSRLILAKLLINPPNFLLLDEPTTHLDVDAVEALIKALTEYHGTIVFISHDIHFVRSLANTVFAVKDGGVRKFPGNFDYYLDKKDKIKQLPAIEKKSSKSKHEIEAKEKDLGMDKAKRKTHNAKVSKKIKKLRKEEEKLKTERYAKSRIVANPRHGHDIIRHYELIIKEIDERLLQIEIEVNTLKSQFYEDE